MANFLRPVFSASCVQHISDLHFKFTGHIMRGSMADIQSATGENRRKKERRNHSGRI